MPGLFASVAEAQPQPYNTVTSPEEQGAAATGNQDSPSPSSMQAFRRGNLPMENIMAAVMRGAAAVQGQEQAKAVAKSQQDGKAKMTVTMKQSPDGGAPLVTVKDAPVDLLNGTQQQDLTNAYNTPKEQVEQKLSGSAAQPAQPAQSPQPAQPGAPQATAPTTQPPADHSLEQAAAAVDASLGYRIARPWDPDIKEKLKSEAGLRQIAEEMGDRDPRATAHQAWRQLQHGKISEQAVIQRVANFRLQRIEGESQHLEAAMAPAERQTARAQAEADRKATEARLQRSQADAETAAGNKEKLDWLKTTDLSTIAPEELEQTARASTNAQWNASEINRARLKQQQDVNKAFLDYTDTKKDTFALGNQPTWAAAKKAFGHPLTPGQDSMGEALWQAAHNYTVRKQNDEDMKRQHADDQHELTLMRLEKATATKPEPLSRSDIKLMDASELVSIDPSTVKNYDRILESKEALLRNEIQKAQDERFVHNQTAQGILKKPVERKQFGDEEQLATEQAKALNLTNNLDRLTKQLQIIQGARAGRRTGKYGGTVQPVTQPAAVPPVPPHAPVANGQYAPRVESGIAAYMQAHGIGRSQAIQALRAAGKIQ